MKDKLENKKGLIERKLQCNLFTVEVDKYGLFHFEKNDEKTECSMLQLLINTSKFNKIGSKELMAKICAIGYLNTPELRNQRDTGWIVVFKNGIKDKNCFCKTLFARIFTPSNSKSFFLDVKNKIIDNHIPYDCSCLILDDINLGYDLNRLPYLVPVEKTPKILITTNSENLTNRSLSFDRRFWILNFSDFYNEHNKPVFDNALRDQLIKDCVDCYRYFGKIQS